MITFVLLVAALVCFLVATLGVAHPRVSFGWLGAALVTVALLMGAYPGA